MIDHPFKPHEVWTTRDQCEHRLDEEKDGAYGICAAPRSEHMDEVHVLKVQLATALREAEELRDAADKWLEERDAANARAEKAEAAAAAHQEARIRLAQERNNLGEALAAARRECEVLRAALEPFAKMANGKDGWPADSGCARFPSMAQVRAARAALAAPAAASGEEGK